MEQPLTINLPKMTERFGIEANTITEMQRVLCGEYDVQRSQEDFSSAQVWSALTAYIEAGSDDRTAMALAHKMQRGIFNMFFGEKGRESVVTSLASAMGLFVAANIADKDKMMSFSQKAVVDIEGILASQGI